MSSGEDLREQLAGQVRVLQIIVAAITFGPLAFLGYVLSTPPPGPPAAVAGNVSLTYLACGAAVAAVAAWFVVPPIVLRSVRRQIASGAWPSPGQAGNSPAAPMTDAGKLCAAYTVRTIIAVAILEGAAFFLVFAYQTERDPLALGVAVLLMLMIAAHFPTRTRVAVWVETQLQLLDEGRQAEQFRR
ncbi:MAG TPA: hypothetical protein VMV10_00300 [Pirellulales bacterium]|nr:hypothetical protein [Pirellulales bacterium]